MELPKRERGDELLRPGEMTDIMRRLRGVAPAHDLTAVVAYAFDLRTRMLPFCSADLRMAPAGVRAIGAAIVESGVPRTRVVLQQWKPNFRPSAARLEGRAPDLLLLSSLAMHGARLNDMIFDAARIDPAHRPLVIAGGPKAIYEPWDVFALGENGDVGADVAVTGEEFVLLQLLEVVIAHKGRGETMRQAFLRAKDAGALDSVPGLVYPIVDSQGRHEALVDTGIQRLLGDFDELPHARVGFALLEPPGRGPGLAARAVDRQHVKTHSPIASIVLTSGCKFRCPYCPIPAYNQKKDRQKSPERIADEFRALRDEYGLRVFFGTDDNFFNSKDRAIAILERLATPQPGESRPVGKTIWWGTEATVHDTLALRDHVKLMRRGGLRAVWMGVEDMTATLVKKGQSVDKTSEAFGLLVANGINAMPMMMHHDSQPLYTRGRPYGLLNQVNILRKAGAVSLQCLMLSPAVGSKLYVETWSSGLAYQTLGGEKIGPHYLTGAHVIASRAEKPWQKQWNMLLAYLFFYNPVRLVWALAFPKNRRLWLSDAGMQVLGMVGLALTVRRTAAWGQRLKRQRIVRGTRPPSSALPMRSASGEAAPHALPGTPTAPARRPLRLEAAGAAP